MYIIDTSYFIREIKVAGLQELRSEEVDNLDLFIDEKARLLLHEALGFNLFNEFDSQVVNGKLRTSTPPDERWSNLVNGVTYTIGDEQLRWQGLTCIQGAFKKSVIAYFAFCSFLEDHVSQLTTMGEVRGNSKNASKVNSGQRYVKIWNKFIDMYQGDYSGCHQGIITPNFFVRRGVPFYDYSYGSVQSSGFVSLLRFLSDNNEDYPDASLKLYDYRNQLGV